MIQIERDGDVATIRMVESALTHAVVDGLWATFAEVQRSASCIVLAGQRDYFSSGAAREVLDDLVTGRRETGELLLPRVLLDCPVPCIAAMAGSAIGGGFALGMAADIVVLAAEQRYQLNFMDLGFTPGMGVTALLEHALTPAVAQELMFTCEARRGRDLAANHVVPAADVERVALDLAHRIADKPRAQIVALKRTLSIRRRQAFESARTQEALMHALAFNQLRNP